MYVQGSLSNPVPSLSMVYNLEGVLWLDLLRESMSLGD